MPRKYLRARRCKYSLHYVRYRIAKIEFMSAITPAEYLAAELISPHKNEYLDGFVFAMHEVNIGHVRITGNICGELGNQLRGPTCEAFSSNLKVRIRRDESEFYYYPDAIVNCSNADNAAMFIEQPRVIFEVMSASTERTDRNEKLHNYQALDSLDVYVLVDQFHVAVTIYHRVETGWEREFLTELDDVIDLPTIECQLPLRALYERTGLT